jgi:hypothetical protein
MRLVDLSIYSSIVADECNPDPAIMLSMLHCVFRDLSKMVLFYFCCINNE